MVTLFEDRDLAVEMLLEMVLDQTPLRNNLARKRLASRLVDRKPHNREAALAQALREDIRTDLVRRNQALVAVQRSTNRKTGVVRNQALTPRGTRNGDAERRCPFRCHRRNWVFGLFDWMVQVFLNSEISITDNEISILHKPLISSEPWSIKIRFAALFQCPAFASFQNSDCPNRQTVTAF
jgi:hypothetical protein